MTFLGILSKNTLEKTHLGLLTERHEVLLRLIKTPNIHVFKIAAPPYAVGAIPDFDVTVAYLNFRLKGFPVSDFQQCDGYTESQRLM